MNEKNHFWFNEVAKISLYADFFHKVGPLLSVMIMTYDKLTSKLEK